MADAIVSGLPPHIDQVICRHKTIGTTIGYKAVYPAEAIKARRAFVARRRASPPSEEPRTPPDEESDAFLAHFEKRKVSVGTCARAFASPCVHEHACVRCSLLRPDPAQRTASRRSGTTCTTASPRPNAKAGSARSRASRSASPDRGQLGQIDASSSARTGRPPRRAHVPRHRRPLRSRPRRTAMTTLDPHEPCDALRAGGCGIHSREAGTSLLIDCGAHSTEPTSPAVHHSRPQRQRQRHPARHHRLGTAIAALHAGELPASGRKRRYSSSPPASPANPVSLNDALPGFDRPNASLVIGAVAHAAGLPDPHQETDKQYLNG